MRPQDATTSPWDNIAQLSMLQNLGGAGMPPPAFAGTPSQYQLPMQTLPPPPGANLAPEVPGADATFAPWRGGGATPADVPPGLTVEALKSALGGGSPPPAASVPRGTLGGETGGAKPNGTADVMNQLDARSLAALQGQGASVDDMKSRLAALTGQGYGTDLSPLAALADSWTGSNLLKGYKAPETPEQRRDAIAKLQDSVLKGQQGMSQDEINMLKDKLNYSFRTEDLSQREKDRQVQRESIQANRDLIASTKADKVDTDRLTTAISGYNKDPQVVDANKKLAEITAARQDLDAARTNPAAYRQIPIVMARMAVNGRLNETELKAYTGGADFSDWAEQMAQKVKDGTITANNYKNMTAIIDLSEKAAKKSLNDRTETHAKQYSTISGKPFAQAANELSGGAYQPTTLAAPKVGEIVDGHKFLGGDPSSQASWEAVK